MANFKPIRIRLYNKLSLRISLYSHFRKLARSARGLYITSTSKGEQKSAIKFHKFPVSRLPKNEATKGAARGSFKRILKRTKRIYVANFSSANNKREKLALLGEDGNTRDRSASSNNRTRHVVVPRPPFPHKRENRRLQGYKRN